MSNSYDLIIIGGGSTGLMASEIAINFGAKILLVEAERMGGDCTWTGCVPSKSLLYSSSLIKKAQKANELGFVDGKINVNFTEIKDYINKTIQDIYEEESPEALKEKGIETIIGQAQFVSPKEISINGRIFKSKKFIIATGAKPYVPFEFIEGLDRTPFLTSNNIFDIEELPKHLVVMGGGPIGCELSQAFIRLGSQVTLIDMEDRILSKDDPDASYTLLDILSNEGVEILLGEPIKKVEKTSSDNIKIFLKSGKEIEGSHLLIAIGRKPNIDSLNLSAAKVETENGFIKVNNILRTSQKNIYAAGDCTTIFQFTHIAGYQGYIAAINALLPINIKGVLDYVPWTTFTDPEVAFVGSPGLFTDLKKGKYKETYYSLKNNDRARTETSTSGFIKLYTSSKGKIVGTTIVSPRAGEMIHEWILVLHNKIALKGIANAIHVYPTYSISSQQLSGDILQENYFSGFLGKIIRLISRLHLR
ncbi:MAG: dihydrolipoyl dehydrogenase family protein [Candidatus Heimdallarchaeaceae archaeon]|jgi:pyruvate/2-oxoglutarate dehydrogenase complex dihydrolipoamide dehydrogenase (E3) component